MILKWGNLPRHRNRMWHWRLVSLVKMEHQQTWIKHLCQDFCWTHLIFCFYSSFICAFRKYWCLRPRSALSKTFCLPETRRKLLIRTFICTYIYHPHALCCCARLSLYATVTFSALRCYFVKVSWVCLKSFQCCWHWWRSGKLCFICWCISSKW